MELIVGDHKYTIGKLNAFKQLAVVRRLLPCLGRLAALQGQEEERRIAAILEILSSLEDADMEYVLNTCLEVVERKQPGGGWAPLRVRDASMFDIGLSDMLQLAQKVIETNLHDFFRDVSFFFARDAISPDNATS